MRSLASGKTLYAQNAGKAFRPASTLKLVTTAAALEALGPDARPRTTLQTAGRLDGFGRILGDLYLVGGGDPNLSARFSSGRPTAAFEAMAEGLLAAGVRRVEGRIVGHEGAFTGERRGSSWTWEDLAWGHGAEVSALSFSDNLVEAQLLPGERVGDPARLSLAPDSGCVNVVSSVTTGEARAAAVGQPAGDQADQAAELTLTREPGSNEVRLTGRLPLGGRLASAVWPSRIRRAAPPPCSRRCSSGGASRWPRASRRRARRCRPAPACWPPTKACRSSTRSASSTRRARTSTPRCCCATWASSSRARAAWSAAAKPLSRACGA